MGDPLIANEEAIEIPAKNLNPIEVAQIGAREGI